MPTNKTIIIVALYVAAVTFINHSLGNSKNTTLTRILVGAYVWLLLLSLLDMFGGALSQLASALAMLAAVYVTLTVFPWQVILKLATGNNGSEPVTKAVK